MGTLPSGKTGFIQAVNAACPARGQPVTLPRITCACVGAGQDCCGCPTSGARDGGLAWDASSGSPDLGDAMAENKQLVVYAAAYATVDAALADLDAIEQLHKDEMIGQYDAAVIDQEDGKP